MKNKHFPWAISAHFAGNSCIFIELFPAQLNCCKLYGEIDATKKWNAQHWAIGQGIGAIANRCFVILKGHLHKKSESCYMTVENIIRIYNLIFQEEIRGYHFLKI